MMLFASARRDFTISVGNGCKRKKEWKAEVGKGEKKKREREKLRN